MASSTFRLIRRGLPQVRQNQRLFSSAAASAAVVPLQQKTGRKFPSGLLLALSGAAVVSQTYTPEQEQAILKAAGEARSELPNYTLAEVAKHNSPATRIWVTFKDGVYDVTDFLKDHPGGEKILLAAGNAVEPFWALYAAHKTPHVLEILETLRVGNIAESDRGKLPAIADPYVLDPDRGDLVVLNAKPFNAQAPAAALTSFITSNDEFFVRNHHPVPVVEPESFQLGLSVGGKAVSWSLSDLQAMPRTDVIATIQCAGNRRSELAEAKGLQWTAGAISTAKWSGVKLSTLLTEAGIKEPKADVYVTFEGLDKDMTGEPYSASITLAEALDPDSGIIVAYAMGDEEIPRDHGYPLRVILPGRIGARSVKWLSRIVVGPEQAKCFFFQKDYKIIPRGETFESFPAATTPPVMRAYLTSVITSPAPGTALPPGPTQIDVTGWAYAGEHVVDFVEVSADGGKTWQRAAVQRGPNDAFSTAGAPVAAAPRGGFFSRGPAPPGRSSGAPPARAGPRPAAAAAPSDPAARPDQPWAWVQWRATVAVPATRPLVLQCRATDVTGARQPERPEDVWNVRGIMNNCWHSVKLE